LTLWHYRHSGFLITSELEIPEWVSFETAPFSEAPDVTIRWQCTAEIQEVRLCAEEYVFFIPEAGFYHVRRTGEITINPVPNPDLKKVRVFLLGTAWGALCHLQSILTLHAAVVQIGGSAHAFFGESGAGKSSLAAKLTTLGYPLLSDDLCRVALSDSEPPVVYRSTLRLKLWQEALTALDYEAPGREQDHARMEKFHVPVSNRPEQESYPLTSLSLLTWGDLGRTRLTGLEALRRLVAAATYRGELLEPMGQLGGHWTRCAELIKQVPVWELSRPRDWTQMASVTALALESRG
jgi:hypothetical protein